MKKLLFAIPAIALLAIPALAQDTTVSIPIGSWVDATAPTIAALLLAVITWGFRKLPDAIQGLLRTAQVDQMLQKAIDFGINTVKGATKDRVLDVDVGNAVIAQALDYVVKHCPAWMIEWLGGEKGIRDRIIARLDLDANAGADPQTILQRA
jgi:hypothetical protein